MGRGAAGASGMELTDVWHAPELKASEDELLSSRMIHRSYIKGMQLVNSSTLQGAANKVSAHTHIHTLSKLYILDLKLHCLRG